MWKPSYLRRSPSSCALLALLLLAGCGGGGGDGRQRGAGGALWLAAGDEAISADGLRRLREVGVHEIFLEVGALAGSPEAPRIERRADLPALPPGTPVSLAIRGDAPGRGVDFAAAASGLVSEVEGLRRDLEGRQLLPVGLHLEVTGGSDGEADEARGKWLAELRERLDPSLFLSVGLAAGDCARDSALAAAREADYVVAWLYGQALQDADSAGAWDPERVLRDLDRLEAAEVDHLVGLRTVPKIEVRGRNGGTRDVTSRGNLRSLVGRPDLERRADDLFAGAGRVVYSFRARRPAEVFGLAAAAGEEFRVVRTSPGVVQDLLKRISARNPRHCLGPLLERPARTGESLALSLDDVVTAFGNGATAPKLTPRIVVKSRRSDTWVIEIVLANEGRQGTDLASTDWNFLQFRVVGAYIGRVVPGDFSRYRFWLDEQEVRPGIGGWREPDEVRLYTPLVEGGDTLRAEIEVRARSSNPTLTMAGSFVLPEGRILELEPWNGSFQQLSSR